MPKNPDLAWIFKTMLESVKKSYVRRLNAIQPSFQIQKALCPVMDPEIRGLFDGVSGSEQFLFTDLESGGSGGSGSSGGTMAGRTSAGTPQDRGFGGGEGSGGTLGTRPGRNVGGSGEVGAGPPVYFDLWATMTCSWAREAEG
jgi:hypothetical protein